MWVGCGHGAVVEKVVSSCDRSTVGPKKGSVPVVTSTLGYQRNLCAGGATLVCVRVDSRYPKLLDCLGVQANHRVTLCRSQLSTTIGTCSRTSSTNNRVCLRVINVNAIKRYV